MNSLLKKALTPMIVVILVLFTLFIRSYHLGSVPKSMHNDEVANTYAARFIFQNGKDIYGNRFPLLYMDKFGDYPPVLPMYVSAIGTYIFGSNEIGSRIGIALFGALFIIPLFLITQIIFKRRLISILICSIAATLPWLVILSRANAEGIVALTVFTWGLYLMFIPLFSTCSKTKSSILTVLGILLLFLTYLIYPSYRIFIPTTFIGLSFLAYLQKKQLPFILTALVISLLLTFGISHTKWGQGRFQQTSIFNDISGVQIQINGLNFDEPNIMTAKIFNNKLIAYSLKYASQYLDYFSPGFLFFGGAYPKFYSVPYSGLLFLTFLPMILFAAFLLKQKELPPGQRNIKLFMIYLLLTAPFAAAMTVLDAPNEHRSLLMTLPILILLGFPLQKLIETKNKIILGFFGFILIVECVFFFHNYFQHANLIESAYRFDGHKEAVTYIAQNKNKYDAVYVTSEEHWLPVYYLFFNKDYSSKFMGKFKPDMRVDAVENIYFPEKECPDLLVTKLLIQKPSAKYLVIDPESCQVDTSLFEEIHTIKRANFTIAFKVYKTKAGL